MLYTQAVNGGLMLGGFYCRVLVKNLDHASEDYFTSFCFEHGAQGVFEDLAFTQPDLVYQAEVRETEKINVNVIFPEQPPENFFLKLQVEFSETTAERFVEANRDWLEEWKKGFEPFLFVDPFWIVPSWRTAPKGAKQVITMEPGMAFGTGTHETTRLAAHLIVKYWKNPNKAIDVGTGTGILAIICEKMGASETIAVDNDPEALRVARENIETNHSKKIQVSEKNISEVKDQYDLVIANIIDGVLLSMKEDLFRIRSQKGQIILSGILKEREEKFIADFLKGSSLKVLERIEDGEWTACLIES